MKKLFILLLFSICFAGYGDSRITVERTWTIEDVEGNFIDFEGPLIVNNSNQEIKYIGIESHGKYVQDDSGTFWVQYKGNLSDSKLSVTATATVNIDYDTNITSDVPLPGKALRATELTTANEKIVSQAHLLAVNSSSLATITNLVNWVHDSVKYDESYWDMTKSAEEIFEERHGVCVHYTHLLISMARSLGFETRYVNGYVLANNWQPHAWAEIYLPSYGWIAADATYGQVGILDNSHVALAYGEDQLSIHDMLLSRNQNATLEVKDKITKNFLLEDPNNISISIEFDNETYVIDVLITNHHPEYVFGSYKFLNRYAGKESSVILLKPHETIHRYYGLNHSLFNNSHSYNVPVSASFNDAKEEKVFRINGNSRQSSLCMLPAALFLLILHLKNESAG